MRPLIFRLVLVFLGLVLACVLSVVAARTEAVAIIETGGEDEVAIVALMQAGGGKVKDAGEGDNVAIAVNTKDGTTVFESAFLITLAAADAAVDQTNAAIAYSRCEACRAISAAIQIVLVPADTTGPIVPENIAAAVNEECVNCETMALAAQYVLGVSGPVEFTKEGNKRIREIRKDLRELGKEADELSLAEIEARFEEIKTKVEDVLANELVPANSQDDDEEDDADGKESSDEKDNLEETTESPESTSETTSAKGTTPETTVERTTGEETTVETTTTEETLPIESPEEKAPTTTPEGTSPAPKETLPGEPIPGEPIPGEPKSEEPETPPQPVGSTTQ